MISNNIFNTNSLYRNSLYLIISSITTALTGFVFWVISTKLYSPYQIGVTTTLISISTLISSFSILGINNGLIRFIYKSSNKFEFFNTGLTITSLIAFILTIFYLLGITILTPSLNIVRHSLLFSLLLFLSTITYSFCLMTDAIFMIYRSTQYIFIKNVIIGLTKIVLPVLFLSIGLIGLFISYSLALILGTLVSLYYLKNVFGYLYTPQISKIISKSVFKFSIANFIGGYLYNFPLYILPIMVTNYWGSTYSAYFYITLTISIFLFTIPMSISQSLFTEGSHKEKYLLSNSKKSIKLSYIFLIPAIIMIIFFGKYVLLVFGSDYALYGRIVLMLLSISSLFITINYIGNTILTIKHRLNIVIVIHLIGSGLIMLFARLFYSYGLTGYGFAFLFGQITISIFYIILIYLDNKKSILSLSNS